MQNVIDRKLKNIVGCILYFISTATFIVIYYKRIIAIESSVLFAILGIVIGIAGVINAIYVTIKTAKSTEVNLKDNTIVDTTVCNNDVNIIAENKYYKLVMEKSLYHYFVFDKNGSIITKGESFSCPDITMVNDNLANIIIQSQSEIAVGN